MLQVDPSKMKTLWREPYTHQKRQVRHSWYCLADAKLESEIGEKQNEAQLESILNFIHINFESCEYQAADEELDTTREG